MVDGVSVTASALTFYTAGTGVRAILKKATFCNNHTSGVTITIYLIPSGGSAGYTNMLTKAHYIEAGETWACQAIENHILSPGGFIVLRASITGVIGARVSGYEVS
jgi:hypothetical protein